MKKTICTIMTLAAVSVALVSCQKEDFSNGPVFRASVERADKTEFHTNNRTFTWKNNDRIHIWDATGKHKLYMPSDDGSTTTNISPIGNYVVSGTSVDKTSGNYSLATSSHYVAVYPDFYFDTTSGRGANSGSVIVTLPSTQVVTNQQHVCIDNLHLTRFPMYCESDDHSLSFKNLCGALKLTLQRANTSVTQIKFTSGASDPAVCGTYSIAWDGSSPSLTPISNSAHTVALEYAQAVSIDNSTDFWIALPAGDYYNFKVEIHCITNGNTQGTISFGGNGTTALTIDRSCVTPMEPNLGTGGAQFRGKGVFSVSNSQQVYFSPGNLQYVNRHWEFASQQYAVAHGMINYQINYVPSYNPDVTNRWDLFGWSTENSDFGTKHSSRQDNYTGFQYKNYGLAFGNNFWRLPSQDEFDYVVNKRVANGKMSITLNGSTDPITNISYRVIKVGNQTGLLLFPDVCSITLPSGVSMPDQYNITSYTVDQFVSIFEKAGCAFLPYAGYQQNHNGADFSLPITLSGTYQTYYQAGRYWTSTPDPHTYNTMHAYAIDMNGTSITRLNSQPRTCLYSVRLVSDVTGSN